jgi:hypothetical protein
VLIRKDEDKKITKSGVHLPDKIEIPTLTGRVVAVSAEVARNSDYPIAQYDRVLFNPKHACRSTSRATIACSSCRSRTSSRSCGSPDARAGTGSVARRKR